MRRHTAYQWFRDGVLPVPAYQVGRRIMVGDVSVPLAGTASGQVVVYARVSSADQKADLHRQVERVSAWALSQEYTVNRAVTEVGSALNGHRRKFLALLEDPSVTTIIVEHRDRFARFATEYIEAALRAQGRRLVVVDPSEVDDDLVRDMTEILTSFCARLYGLRSAQHRAEAMTVAAEQAGDGGDDG